MKEFETNEEFIYALIIDELDETISHDHKLMLQRWRSHSSTNEQLYQNFVQIQKNIDELHLAQHRKSGFFPLIKRLSTKLTESKYMIVDRSHHYQLWTSLIAVIIVAVLLFLLLLDPGMQSVLTNSNHYSIKNSYLPDGSKLSINKGTLVKYTPNEFDNNRFLKLLNGEIFIEVLKNKSPLVIDLGPLKLAQVSGRVNIIKGSQRIRIVMEDGLASLTNKRTNDIQILRKGMTAGYSITTGKLTQGLNHDKNYKSWYNKEFFFVNTPLEEVTQQLSLAYHVPVLIKDNELKKLKVTAHFQNQDADSTLNYIAKILHCEVVNLEIGYIISKNTEVALQP